MNRNVEIKAKVSDFSKFLAKAEEISGQKPILIPQEDTFFHSKQGRLKLREFPGNDKKPAELIQYDRPDVSGPKISGFIKVGIDEPAALKQALTLSNGVLGNVSKIRYLFLVGQTRIHADRVDNLGEFMELEVCLKEKQTLEEGQAIAEALMEKLGITKDDLIEGAYMDALLAP
ncbi:unnamed protein product [Bursaphelenchus xylophilus]|uniref:(pine wood nematode) hypothetical protein n=1 Tax=Bursaphelenchus xylophilus TaxID=6326 RepID=A0A1I7RP42_BURXY|nr:unnamed protein product [Bursaphelenchus xylophilus]CAG9124532.1 unnamed protein product [Bursaphelenchus xylophilus]